MAKLPTAKLSIRAQASPDTVGSVVFGLNNQSHYRVENVAPYALTSNNPDNSYVPFPFQLGEYTLIAPLTRKQLAKAGPECPYLSRSR